MTLSLLLYFTWKAKMAFNRIFFNTGKAQIALIKYEPKWPLIQIGMIPEVQMTLD